MSGSIGVWANAATGVKGVGFVASYSVGVEGTGGTGVKAIANPTNGFGLVAQSQSGTAVLATTTSGMALSVAASTGGLGVYSITNNQNAIRAFVEHGTAHAIFAATLNDNLGNAITGQSNSRNGVEGNSYTSSAGGVYGENMAGGYGVAARSNSSGNAIWGENWSSGGYAGYFNGRVHVNGTLSKSLGTFKIDHPDDPSNKYLIHSFVESPEMLNVYTGIVATDAVGEAWVVMPSYWPSLNIEPRYQLTAIGAPGNLFIKQEYNPSDNRFRIGGAAPLSKVSWQLTGVRNDPYARANRIQVEVTKDASERGRYLNPEVYRRSAAQGMRSGPPAARPGQVSPEARDATQ